MSVVHHNQWYSSGASGTLSVAPCPRTPAAEPSRSLPATPTRVHMCAHQPCTHAYTYTHVCAHQPCTHAHTHEPRARTSRVKIRIRTLMSRTQTCTSLVVDHAPEVARLRVFTYTYVYGAASLWIMRPRLRGFVKSWPLGWYLPHVCMYMYMRLHEVVAIGVVPVLGIVEVAAQPKCPAVCDHCDHTYTCTASMHSQNALQYGVYTHIQGRVDWGDLYTGMQRWGVSRPPM